MSTMSSRATIADWAVTQPRSFWALSALVVVVVVGMYCVTAAAYINPDVFVMAEVAQSVLSGKTLYGTACWDNKPPLTLLAYAIPQLVLPRSYLAIQAFLGAWLILQAAVFVYFLRNEPIVATILGAAALILVPLLDKEFLWASSEHWHNLFALLVILPSFQLWKNQTPSLVLSVLAGACVVLTMHCRQTGVLLGIIPLMAVCCCRISFRSKLAMFTGGAAGAIAAWLGMLALCGSLGDLAGYFDATFMAPGRYSDRRLGALLSTAYFYFATYRNSALGLLLLAALVGAMRRSDFALIGVVAIVTMLQIVAPTRTQPHYMMQALPLLAIALQASLARLNAISITSARSVSLAIASFLLMNGLFAVLTMPHGRAAHTMADLNSVAATLRSEADPTETMFAVGNDSAYLYFSTGIASVHPIFWDMFFGSLSAVIPYRIDNVVDSYMHSPPNLLVLSDEVYAVSTNSLALPNDMSPCIGAVALSRELVQHHDYREINRVHGWVILRHQSVQSAMVGQTHDGEER